MSNQVIPHPLALSIDAVEEWVELAYFFMLFALSQVEALSAALEAASHFHTLEDALQRDVSDFRG